MKNCLVTKLKGTVNNPDLLKLGEIRFKALKPYANGSYLTIGAGSAPILCTYLVGSDREGNTERTIGAGTSSNLTALDAGAVVSMEKYGITKIACNAFEIDFDSLEFSDMSAMSGTVVFVGDCNLSGDMGNIVRDTNKTNITKIQIEADNKSTIKFSKLGQLTAMTQFIALRTVFDGVNLADFSTLTALTLINIQGTIGSTGIEGSINSLAGLTSLTTVHLVRSKINGNISALGALINCGIFDFVECANLTGTLESLIDALRTAGRTGQTIFNFSGTNVTYQGNPMTDPVTITL